MHPNDQIIQKFYTAFQKLDYTTMQDCYSINPIFNDAVFGVLEGDEVRNMWEMLCKNAKNFSLTFSNIQRLDEEYVTCDWTAAYTFSGTGKTVINNVKAHIRIQNDKIIEHSDKFDIWKWSRQALGVPGMLLGWSNFMKNKIHKNALNNLALFTTAKNIK